MPKAQPAAKRIRKTQPAIQAAPDAQGGEPPAEPVEAAEDRGARLAALRAAIVGGRYRISSEQIATKLIKGMRRE